MAEQEYKAAVDPLAALTIRPILDAARAALGANPEGLIVSADAKLWLVPLAALTLADGTYAVEAVQLSLVTSGRDLVDPARDAKRREAVGKPLIMAAPDFDSASPGRAPAGSSLRGLVPIHRPISALRIGRATPLPGTLEEAKAVAPAVRQLAHTAPDLVVGAEATEARFKVTARPSIVILATHGFFQPEQRPADALAGLQGGDSGVRGLRDAKGEDWENPLTRCGLLFAGCNRASTAPADVAATEDGVLTGLEVVGCDLRGTDLVVLSACQTGLGDVEAGQGVAGLRQAFQLAGAKSVISTLWSVPDQETSELSASMFANLAGGKSAAESLREAQIALIRQRIATREASHPFFWAAFNVTGR